ncbi:putative ribonuclease H-like domain-containing protein [Tanacetum coccineum]
MPKLTVQNGVAERMNRTLIEAAKTMLADSLLPTTFWAEVVSTACYILNRVFKNRVGLTPQNAKLLYELLFGHKPIISYIRPFGCHVTILDTLSVLGKFDGKSDEGFLVGYSLNSKAYRVYNLVTKRVEVNLHVNFLEDKPNVKGVGYRWMFDIDYLTDSMNYIPVSLENQANPPAGTSEVTNSAGTSQTLTANASEEKDEDAELIVVSSAVKNTAEKVEPMKSSTTSKKEEILTEPQHEKEASSTDTSEDNPKILAFRRELEEIALKNLGTVPENNPYYDYPSVHSGSEPSLRQDFLMRLALMLEDVVTDSIAYQQKSMSSPTSNSIGFTNIHSKRWSKALYGLHQAPRAWYATLSTFLEKHGYKRGTIDKTLFVKRDKKDIMLMSSMGELTFFLGLQVKQNKEGIFISQDKYVAEILKKFDLVSVKTAITPIETKVTLTKDEEAVDVDVTPKTLHLNVVKRIFKYLKGKPNLGLWYPRESPFDLKAFSDSDYGGSNLDRKSTTGGCQFLGQRLIFWPMQNRTICGTSIILKAEYVAAANCCRQVLWVQNQLLDYGFNFMNTKIHIDNESTICIVKNPVYHSKTKHIEIRHHFIRDCYEKKLIKVEKIQTDLNVADLLTKSFDGPRYALTTNPTIHDSLVKQFWQTATAKNLADGTLELHATIDTIANTITEASIRSKLKLANASGITMLPNTEIFEEIRHMGEAAQGKLHRLWESVILTLDGTQEENRQGRKFHALDPVKKIKSLIRKEVTIEGELKESAGTGLDFEEVKSVFEEVNTGGIKVSAGIEEINAGSLDVNIGIDSVTTDIIRVLVPSPDRGRREEKAPMTEEEETQASRKTKEQILQEEAGLAEAIRLDALEKALEKEEVAKQVHLDSLLLAQMDAEEQELTAGQRKGRLKSIEGECVLGKDLTIEDYANQGWWYIIPFNPVPQLYRIVMKKHGMNEPEDEFEKVPQIDSPEQTATGKGISNPFMAIMVYQKPYGIQLTMFHVFESCNGNGCSVDHGMHHSGGKGLATSEELALLCGKMFPKESNKIEKYVDGLPDMIHGSVGASKPKTMQDAVEITTELMDKKIRTFAECQTKSKRKFEDTSRNTQNQQQQ